MNAIIKKRTRNETTEESMRTLKGMNIFKGNKKLCELLGSKALCSRLEAPTFGCG